MTRTQQQYYLAIRDFVSKYKRFPTFKEIADRTGVSALATVYKAISYLVAQGYVVRNGKSYELVPEKMYGLSNCSRGHEPIWFMSGNCPLCSVLARIPT